MTDVQYLSNILCVENLKGKIMFDFENLSTLLSWQHILVAGLGVMALELFIAEFFLIWVGLSVLLTGLTMGIFGLTGTIAAMVFCLYTIVLVAIGFWFYEQKSNKVITSNLNNRNAQLVGKVAQLQICPHTNSIDAGFGSPLRLIVEIDGTIWPVVGANNSPLTLLQGEAAVEKLSHTWVKVVELQNNILVVECFEVAEVKG